MEKVRGGRNRKEKVGDEKKKPIEFSLKSPRCTLNTPHLTSPDWKKNGVQGNKNHKNIFCIRKKGIRFFTKRWNKKSNLVFQQKINAYALKKAKTRGPPPQPISHCSSHLSLSRERGKKKTKTQPFNQLPIKPPNHGIYSRQQRNDPASRSRKKKRTRKAKTPADSSDHDSQRNRPGPHC